MFPPPCWARAFFTTDKANTYTDAQAFYTMASYALLGTDVTIGNADAYLPYFAEGGAMQAYKQLFNLPTCVTALLRWGWMSARWTTASRWTARPWRRKWKPPVPPAPPKA